MKLILALICGLFWLWPATVAFAGFSLGPFVEFEDVSGYARSFGGDETGKLASGVCPVHLWEWKRADGRWIANIFSPCLLGAVKLTGEADPNPLVGAEIVNLLGLRGGVYIDPISGKGAWTLMLSLTGLGQQLSKP